MNDLIVTLWRTYSRGRRSPHTWSSFIDTFVREPEVVHNKRTVAGFSLASFEGNRRMLSRVEKVFALTLDFDEGDTTFDEAVRLFPENRRVIYTTYSHTIEKPKLRIILPLSRPVDGAEYERVWTWATSQIAKVGHKFDESTSDASRFWFLPSHAPGAPYEWKAIEGAPYDAETAIREADTHTRLLSGDRASRKPRKAPKGHPRPEKSRVCEAGSSFFGRAFVRADMACTDLPNGALAVVCPWASEHTTGHDGDSSTVILPSTDDSPWELFHCSHAHCAKRTTLDLLDVLPIEALEAAREECGYGLVRTKIRRGWVEHLNPLPGFPALDRLVLRCWPREAAKPIVWNVKIGCPAHIEGLEGLSVEQLVGRHVDLAIFNKVITWGRLSKC